MGAKAFGWTSRVTVREAPPLLPTDSIATRLSVSGPPALALLSATLTVYVAVLVESTATFDR